MALDEALMTRARRSGESVLRLYQWSEPTLSLGRNQRAAGLYDLDAARRSGVRFVRRITGGRALVHYHEFTYSVTAPVAAGSSIRESYSWINRLLIDALGRLGVEARPATGSRAMPPDATPCFEAPSAGELVVDGRKLVGSAQWRDDGAMLQHGSILIADDQQLAVSLLNAGGSHPPRPATLRDVIGRVPDAMEVLEALAAALRDRTEGSLSLLEIDADLNADAARARLRYIADDWTWRR